MNTAKYVDDQIPLLKSSGIPLSQAAWQLALLCVGCPYLFGDRGQYCTPSHRQALWNKYQPDHKTIYTKCKVLKDGASSCSGCGFYPGGKTRAYDCRGFTYWILKQIYDWELKGAGATSQWTTESNWKAKGTIDTMPADTLVCLFVANGKTMEHTGLGLNNETIECSNGVQHFTSRNKKWTHWGLPMCIDGTVPPSPAPDPDQKPTLRRGSKGEYVLVLQAALKNRGYDIGSSGVDGVFGKATEAAVKAFQKDNGLKADGICGPLTWQALDVTPAPVLYTVTIPNLTASLADELLKKYPGSTKTEERG